jgi:hypothetical protein
MYKGIVNALAEQIAFNPNFERNIQSLPYSASFVQQLK